MELEDFYTVPEITTKLKVEASTIRRWIKQGKMKAYRFGGNYRIPKSDFDQFMENSMVSKKTEKKRKSLEGIFKNGKPIPEEAIAEVVKVWNIKE